VGYYLLHTKDAELCIEEIVINTILAELAQEKVEEPAYAVAAYTAGSVVTGI
jgi:hypothetical protein